MSNQPIHWISIDGTPTEDELESVVKTLDDLDATDDLDFVVTTREVQPMGEKERFNFMNELVEAVDSMEE